MNNPIGTEKNNGFAPLVIVAIVALVIGGGYLLYSQQTSPHTEVTEVYEEPALMTEMTEKEKSAETVEQEGDGMTRKYLGTVLAGKLSPLLDFKKADYDAARASEKLVVLYFYANWCPLCKVEFPLMQAAFNELTTDAVIGFRVNYNDNETDADEKALAREFGVAYQHTKVFLKNGERILKSPESWDEKRYDVEIAKFTQ